VFLVILCQQYNRSYNNKMLTKLYLFNLLLLVFKSRPSQFWKVQSIFLTLWEETLHICQKLSPASSDGTTTLQYFFSLSKFYLTKLAREQAAAYVPRSSCKHGDHGTLPPCPKSCQNMTRTWDTSAKQFLHTAGLSACWFDASNDKKARLFTYKNTPFVSMLSDQLHMEQIVIK